MAAAVLSLPKHNINSPKVTPLTKYNTPPVPPSPSGQSADLGQLDPSAYPLALLIFSLNYTSESYLSAGQSSEEKI